MGKQGLRYWEYKEHTADVKVVGYGNTIKRAFEALALGIMNIMYDVSKVEPKEEKEFELESEDIISTLYDFLTQILDTFYIDNFAVGDVKIKNLRRKEKKVNDKKIRVWYCRFKVKGEKYNPEKHGRGKEVKAITYNEMNVEKVKEGLWKAECVVDI